MAHMNWSQRLLGGTDPALGLKRLDKPNAKAEAFVSKHQGMRSVAHALTLGMPGQVVPNIADAGNQRSVAVSFHLLEKMCEEAGNLQAQVVPSGQASGSRLELAIERGLAEFIAEHKLRFDVGSKSSNGNRRPPVSFALTDYWPYMTPPVVTEPPDVEQTYKRLGRGHLIQPDVVVWQQRDVSFARVKDGEVTITPFEIRTLHACISGKATIRSDRSQSSRYEGSTVSRWRRARPPAMIVVTAEPVPSRLGSLAWGLGDLDAIYHVNLKALYHGLAAGQRDLGETKESREEYSLAETRELIEYARLRDISQLAEDLFADYL